MTSYSRHWGALHSQVKGDNQEMGTLERRIHELKAEIAKSSEDLEITENVSHSINFTIISSL